MLPGKLKEPRAGDDCATWRDDGRDLGNTIVDACRGQYVLIESFQGEVLASAINRSIVVLERIATALETIGRKS